MPPGWGGALWCLVHKKCPTSQGRGPQVPARGVLAAWSLPSGRRRIAGRCRRTRGGVVAWDSRVPVPGTSHRVVAGSREEQRGLPVPSSAAGPGWGRAPPVSGAQKGAHTFRSRGLRCPPTAFLPPARHADAMDVGHRRFLLSWAGELKVRRVPPMPSRVSWIPPSTKKEFNSGGDCSIQSLARRL